MKRSIGILCAAALIANLAACGGDDKGTPPTQTSGSTPSATLTSRPNTTAPTATTTGPVPLAAHSTYAYGGLTFVVNLPADIPSESRPSMRLFSEFLQGVGRTTAQNTFDPSLSKLASKDVVKYVQTFVGPVSVQGIGSVTYTLGKVQTDAGPTTLVTGCLDQSKLVQVRNDGTHFVDAGTHNYPFLKMSASINRGLTGPTVTRFTFAKGPC